MPNNPQYPLSLDRSSQLSLHASQQITNLGREIEAIVELNKLYRFGKYHSYQDRIAHEKRKFRLQEIMQQLAALRPKCGAISGNGSI